MTKPSDSSNLTKVCSSCGIQKPLSAFLQLSGGISGIYGSICNACRKANAEKSRNTKKEAEGSTTISSGRVIDAKAKIGSDLERKEEFKQEEQEYHDERDEAEILEKWREEKTISRAKEERKHRERTLDKQPPIENKETIKAETLEALAAEEHLKTDTSFDKGPVEYSRVEQMRFTQSPIFNTFKAWLGGSAPIVTTIQKATTEKNATVTHTGRDGFLHTKVESPTVATKDPLIDFAEKNWTPGTKGR